MINLIPNKEKREMSKEFYFRLIALTFLMLGISLLVFSILILPSYLLASSSRVSFLNKLEEQKKEIIPLPDQNTILVIKNLKNKINLIETTEKNKKIFSQRILNEIILKKIPNIKITEIIYKNDMKEGEKISISGRASSREVLLSFRRTLEDNPAFSKVDLPISNFIKGSNIRFYLTLIPS
ncbi:MAG: hypothetical protein NDI62_00840 [Burkholderiales bacterium]|nr:hypothetical protein [Burkholderiales bacterium]